MASRKLQVYDFAKRYRARWGRSPSYGEIANELGISRVRVQQHVRSLVEEGMVVRNAGDRRGIGFPNPLDQLSEADALLRLAQLGYDLATVFGGPPLTNTSLPLPIELDHIPDIEIGEIQYDRAAQPD